MSEQAERVEMGEVGQMLLRGHAPAEWSGSDRNQQIVQAIREVFDQGRPVCLTSVAEHLRRKSLLEAVGSYPYLTELWELAVE